MKQRLLLLAIIVLAGGLAIFALNRPPKSENQNSSSAQSNQSTGPSQQQDNSDQFLVVKEWGVRFEVTKKLQDEGLSYQIDSQEPGVTYSSLQFNVSENSSLKECINISLYKQNYKEFEAQGWLNPNNKGDQKVTLHKTMDGVAYFETRRPSWCDAENAPLTVEAERLMDEISDSIKGIQKTQT